MFSFQLHQILKQARRRQNLRHPQSIKTLKWLGLICLISFSLVFAAVIFGAASAYNKIVANLPSVDYLPLALDPVNGLFLQPTRIYDRTGNTVLYSLEQAGIERKFLSLDQTEANHFSPEYVSGVISFYEPGYWNQSGIDWLNILNSKPTTISERLVNDVLLSTQSQDLTHTLSMKLLSNQIIQKYGKKQVLEWFLNSQYFGRYTFGADNAARLYLGKSAASLNLAESAFLIAIAESPALNPIDSPASALEGRRSVLVTWVNNGSIQSSEVDTLLGKSITLSIPPLSVNQNRPFYVNLVIHQAELSIPTHQLERGNIKIISTLDLDIQEQLICTVHQQLIRLRNQDSQSDNPDNRKCKASALLPTLPSTIQYTTDLSSSAVILDLHQGEILGLAGDTGLSGDTGHLLLRNPGTLLTPFVSLAAFQRGYSPANLVWDIPARMPSNLQKIDMSKMEFHGAISLRTAISNDYLTPIYELLDQLGASNIWLISQPLGLRLSGSSQDPISYLESGSKTSLMNIAAAYSTIANQGTLIGQVGEDRMISPNIILQVKDGFGSVLLDRSRPVKQSIVNPPLAFLVNDILEDNISRRDSLGNPNWLDIGRPSAAKIGQVQNKQDSWTVGYTPHLLVAVWVGSPESVNTTTNPLDYRTSTGIWNAIMTYSHQKIPADDWQTPEGILRVEVCNPSGDLPTRICPAIVKEVFLDENEPNKPDTLYRQFQINRETGRLATIFTPIGQVDTRIYLVPPVDALAWYKSSGKSIAPDIYDDIQIPPIQPGVSISEPQMYASIHGTVSIRGNASGSQFNNFHLEVGKGLNPESWQQISQKNLQPVNDGQLGSWNTKDFEDGLYVLRLTVEDNDQTIRTTIVQVIINNIQQ